MDSKAHFFFLSEVNPDQDLHINKDKLCIGGKKSKIRNKETDREKKNMTVKIVKVKHVLLILVFYHIIN